jgi:hypothetical protein
MGLRRRSEGNDPNLGPLHESRWRGTGLKTGLEEVQLTEAPPPESDIAQRLWRYFLNPETIQWLTVTRLGIPSSVTGSSISIPLYEVPRGQVLVLLEWTPLYLMEDLARPGLLRRVVKDPDAFLGMLSAELRVGTAPVQASSGVFGASDSPTLSTAFRVRQLAGTYRMNELGYVANYNHPFTIYAGDGAIVETVFQVGGNVADDVDQLNLQDLPAGASSGDGMFLGGRMFGLSLSQMEFDRLKGSTR